VYVKIIERKDREKGTSWFRIVIQVGKDSFSCRRDTLIQAMDAARGAAQRLGFETYMAPNGSLVRV
jgi:hypothetical protein